MKRHLNTLFVTTQGAYLACQGETVKVRIERETRMRVPIHLLGSIVCFGQVACSPPLLGLCCERGVQVAFLTERGRFLGRVEGSPSGNVLLRRTQFRRADEPTFCTELARTIVLGKVANSRAVLLRAAREQGAGHSADALRQSAQHLAALIARWRHAGSDLEAIRGFEGEAARSYFQVFDNLITVQKRSFRFEGRSRRPPLDRINCLLSFVYTLLASDVTAALDATGLDSQVGYLHRDRPGRPSLALDLMEELRPSLADRLVLTLVNQRQITGRNFTLEPAGAVWLNKAGRRTVLEAYQERKRAELRHPFLDEKVTVGLLPFIQARLLARYLRGDLDGYPPFHWR